MKYFCPKSELFGFRTLTVFMSRFQITSEIWTISQPDAFSKMRISDIYCTVECQNLNVWKPNYAEIQTFLCPIPRQTHATSTSENQTSSASLDRLKYKLYIYIRIRIRMYTMLYASRTKCSDLGRSVSDKGLGIGGKLNIQNKTSSVFGISLYVA